MSPDAALLEDLDPDDPRTASQQIANRLRAAILTRRLQPGDKLPSQNELAGRYDVARETVKSALRILDRERLIISRQGSGAYVRAQTERPVGLRPHVEAAFEQPHVSIDFAGFSGETLANTLAEALDKVRAGRLTPSSIALRVLVTDTTRDLAVPRRVDADSEDSSIRRRSDRINRRSLDALIDGVTELGDLGFLESASAQVRVHELAPTMKLYILNSHEVFFGFYPIIEHTITVGGEAVPIYDVMGKDATLFHFSGNDDDTSDGPQFVEQSRLWFDSIWTTVSREYARHD